MYSDLKSFACNEENIKTELTDHKMKRAELEQIAVGLKQKLGQTEAVLRNVQGEKEGLKRELGQVEDSKSRNS